jgi:outer membrane biosynthesis protein TonB
MWMTAATVVAVGATACRQDTTRASDDLAKDLQLASSPNGLALASASTSQQTTVSAIERGERAVSAPAPSRRVATPRKAPPPTPDVAPVSSTSDDAEPAVVETPAPEPQVAQAPTPDPMPSPAPRPHPVDVTVGNTGDGNGTIRRTGDGTDIATGIGTVIGVIIRGGVVDGDHCDPRPRRRGTGRRGGPIISGMPGGVIRYETTPVHTSGRPALRGGL